MNGQIVIEPPDNYHSVQALSKNMMDHIFTCPAKFKYEWDRMGQKREKASDTLLLGSLFHAMVLEPDNVAERYAVKRFSGTTKDGKSEAAEAGEKGITLVKADIWETCEGMAERVNALPLIRLAKASGDWTTEQSIYWEHDGIPCKARLDAVATIPGFGRCIIDLKNTLDASPEHIRKALLDFGYHRQAAWYREASSQVGQTAEGFVFVFCEKLAPFVTTVATVSEEAMNVALEEIRTGIELFKECSTSGEWPAYSSQVLSLDLPEWFMKRRVA